MQQKVAEVSVRGAEEGTPLSLSHKMALDTASIFGLKWDVKHEEALRALMRTGDEWGAEKRNAFLSRYCLLFELVLSSAKPDFEEPSGFYMMLAGHGRLEWRLGVSAFDIDWQPRAEVVRMLYMRWEKYTARRMRRFQKSGGSDEEKERFCKEVCAVFLAIRPFENYNSRIMMLTYFMLRQRVGLPLKPVPFEEARNFFRELSAFRRDHVVPRFKQKGYLTGA